MTYALNVLKARAISTNVVHEIWSQAQILQEMGRSNGEF